MKEVTWFVFPFSPPHSERGTVAQSSESVFQIKRLSWLFHLLITQPQQL